MLLVLLYFFEYLWPTSKHVVHNGNFGSYRRIVLCCVVLLIRGNDRKSYNLLFLFSYCFVTLFRVLYMAIYLYTCSVFGNNRH